MLPLPPSQELWSQDSWGAVGIRGKIIPAPSFLIYDMKGRGQGEMEVREKWFLKFEYHYWVKAVLSVLPGLAESKAHLLYPDNF